MICCTIIKLKLIWVAGINFYPLSGRFHNRNQKGMVQREDFTNPCPLIHRFHGLCPPLYLLSNLPNEFLEHRFIDPTILLAPHVDCRSSHVVFSAAFFHTLPVFELFQDTHETIFAEQFPSLENCLLLILS